MSPPLPAARKSLGQHFLRDRAALRDIAERCSLPGVDVLFEIGPGRGALTAHLVGLAPRLVLVEKDRQLVALLTERFGDRDDVTVVEADAVRFDFGSWLEPGAKAVVAGNLPYNAASPIYYHLLAVRGAGLQRLVLMFQREVAERLVAAPGGRTYGAPSVATAFFTEARLVRRLPPDAFRPRPRVHSAVVQVDPRPAPLHPVADEARFLAFVRGVFRFRRKTLANAMTQAGVLAGRSATEVAGAAGVEPRVRAEQLDAGAFWRLYTACGGA